MAPPRAIAAGPAFFLLTLLLLLPSCGDKVECAPGTIAQGDECVALCEEGTEPHPSTGACVQSCVAGTYRDPSSGACLPNNARCVSGAVWDVDSEECVDVDDICSAGTTWVAGERRCVHDEELRVPDQFEGDEPNNWLGGGHHRCERFDLPAVGERWSIGGRIDPPADPKFPLPDMDCWNFDTDEPTLLRIHADGIGGAAAAFKVVRDDGNEKYVDRVGVGTTGASVTRDLFLPRATTYALVTTDVMNLIGGVIRGSESFGYYVEIERLPLPEPERLSGTGTIKRGRWTGKLEDGQTHLGFYEIPAEKDSLVYIGLHTPTEDVWPVFTGFTPCGKVVEADRYHQPFPSAFDRDGTMLMVADYEWWFAGEEDSAYSVSLEPQHIEMVGPGETTLDVHRPAWRGPGAFPTSYYGFHVEGGDVQRVTLETSTGYTCFSIWDNTFTWMADRVGCFIISTPIDDFEITFVPETDGIWVLAVSDWSGGRYSAGGLVSLPARDLEVRVGIHPQTPLRLGDLSSPHSSDEVLTTSHPVRWIALDPSERGQAYRLTVEPGQLWPRFRVFHYGDILSAPKWEFDAEGESLVLRSPDARPRLISIGDPLIDSASFTLVAERYEPIRLDVPDDGGALKTTLVLPAGEAPRFEVSARSPSDLVLTLTPPPGVQIAYLPSRPDYRAAEDHLQRGGGQGDALSVRQGLKPTPFAFQIVDRHGRPLHEDVEIEVEARLEPLMVEQEPNDSPEEATPLPLSTPMAGARSHSTDIDWYRLELTEATTIDLLTRPLGLSKFGWVNISVYDENLFELWDAERLHDDRLYPDLRVSVSEPTTLYVRVRPFGDEWQGYVIEATASSN